MGLAQIRFAELVNTRTGHRVQVPAGPHINNDQGVQKYLQKMGPDGRPIFMLPRFYDALPETEREAMKRTNDRQAIVSRVETRSGESLIDKFASASPAEQEAFLRLMQRPAPAVEPESKADKKGGAK